MRSRSFVGFLTGAAQRGVDVRLLLAGPRTDVRRARFAGRARYERLLAAGVRIWEWQPTTLHAKTFVVDGIWSSIGSMNFDNRSLVPNDESALMILDRNAGERMNEVFLDDLQYAEEISLERFRRRGVTSRIAEWGANPITRLL